MPTIHRNTAQIKRMVTGIVDTFVKTRLMPIITRNLDFCDSCVGDQADLLKMRQQLRDEVSAALYEKDDKLMHLLETGEETKKGHEPMIALLAMLIDYQIDERFKEAVKRKEYM